MSDTGTSHVVPIFTEIHKIDSDGQDLQSGENMQVPILPLRNMVLFPGMATPVAIGREKSLKLVKEAMKQRTETIEEEEETVAQQSQHVSTNNHAHDDVMEDDIVDTGHQTAVNTIDADEIQPVDSGGGVATDNDDVLTAELQNVNPDEVAQALVMEADDADNLMASHAIEEVVVDEDVASLFNEEEITVDEEDIDVSIAIDPADEELLSENTEGEDDEVIDDEEIDEEEDDIDEDLDEDLADADDSEEMGDIIDDIV